MPANNKYWVGGADSTDWSNSNNWALTDGGAGGAGVPSSTSPVYFTDISGSGNCTLSEDVSANGIYFTSGITYDLIDNGYTIENYGGFDAYSTTQVLQCTGEFRQKANFNAGTFQNYPTSNNLGTFILESGVSITLTNYLHIKKFVGEADSYISSASNWLLLTYPTENHFYDAHPTHYCEQSVRFYVTSTNVSNSGIDKTMGGLFFGYGGTAGATYTTLGDITLGATGTGPLTIHASNGAITEAQTRKLDMNGYSLNCNIVTLGAGTTSYDGYGGMIRFSTGEHHIGGCEMSYTGENKNTYGYWDWGSGVINVTGNCDFEVSSDSYTHNGAARFIMNGAGSDFVNCSGMQLPTVEFNKTSGGVWLESNLNCDDFNYRGGSIDQNGHQILMPQRVRPLTIGPNKLLIGKKWVN